MIFIDTGAFVARYVGTDQYHQRAVRFWKQLARTQERCSTSNFVLAETFTLLGRRAGYQFAAERARIILASTSLVIMRPAGQDELAAIELLEQFADQEVSFTDCISFVLMRRSRTKRAFSFDRHFELAGFRRCP